MPVILPITALDSEARQKAWGERDRENAPKWGAQPFLKSLSTIPTNVKGKRTVRPQTAHGPAVTLTEYSLVAFTILNGGRAIAYVPQAVRLWRDPHGAAAVSAVTWMMFAAANVATVVYILASSGDRIAAAVFAFNALACLMIVCMTLWKRLTHRHGTDLCRFALLRIGQALRVHQRHRDFAIKPSALPDCVPADLGIADLARSGLADRRGAGREAIAPEVASSTAS